MLMHTILLYNFYKMNLSQSYVFKCRGAVTVEDGELYMDLYLSWQTELAVPCCIEALLLKWHLGIKVNTYCDRSSQNNITYVQHYSIAFTEHHSQVFSIPALYSELAIQTEVFYGFLSPTRQMLV
jgi:hypothetical protein